MRRLKINILKICLLINLQLADYVGRSGLGTKACPSGTVVSLTFLLLY